MKLMEFQKKVGPEEKADQVIQDARDAAPHMDDEQMLDFLIQLANYVTGICNDRAAESRKLQEIMNLTTFVAEALMHRIEQARAK